MPQPAVHAHAPLAAHGRRVEHGVMPYEEEGAAAAAPAPHTSSAVAATAAACALPPASDVPRVAPVTLLHAPQAGLSLTPPWDGPSLRADDAAAPAAAAVIAGSSSLTPTSRSRASPLPPLPPPPPSPHVHDASPPRSPYPEPGHKRARPAQAAASPSSPLSVPPPAKQNTLSRSAESEPPQVWPLRATPVALQNASAWPAWFLAPSPLTSIPPSSPVATAAAAAAAAAAATAACVSEVAQSQPLLQPFAIPYMRTGGAPHCAPLAEHTVSTLRACTISPASRGDAARAVCTDDVHEQPTARGSPASASTSPVPGMLPLPPLPTNLRADAHPQSMTCPPAEHPASAGAPRARVSSSSSCGGSTAAGRGAAPPPASPSSTAFRSTSAGKPLPAQHAASPCFSFPAHDATHSLAAFHGMLCMMDPYAALAAAAAAATAVRHHEHHHHHHHHHYYPVGTESVCTPPTSVSGSAPAYPPLFYGAAVSPPPTFSLPENPNSRAIRLALEATHGSWSMPPTSMPSTLTKMDNGSPGTRRTTYSDIFR